MSLRLCLTMLCSLVLFGCGGDSAPAPSGNAAANPDATVSRDAFLGTWKGTYHGFEDELVIKAGETESDVIVTIHAKIGGDPDNAEDVNGKIVGNQIKIPEQSMGGAPGTAVITLDGDKLQYAQSGQGMTIEGKDYLKQ